MYCKKTSPLVSVCIPCYNHEKFVSDCFESLIAQTYGNIELLICDDCSKDTSWAIINKYKSLLEERFARVIMIRNSVNLGISKTLNKLLPLSNGNYIKIIASDDFLAPMYMETMIEEMENKKNIGVLFCNGICVKEDSTYQNPLLLAPFYSEIVQIDNEEIEKRLFENCFVFAPSVVLRKDVYNECGFYNEDIEIEDWEYWLRVACSKKFQFGYLDVPLVYYRKSDHAMTSRTGEGAELRFLRMYKAEKRIIELYKDKMGRGVGARRKIWHIIYNERVAYKFSFKNAIRLIKNDYKNFKDWEELSIKDRLICSIRHFFRIASKMI